MDITLSDLPLVTFLERLRRAIFLSLLGVLLLTCVAWFFTDRAIELILSMVEGIDQLIYVNIVESLFTRLKLAVAMGFVAAMPWILWQLRLTLVPLMKPTDKGPSLLMLFLAVLLFYGGLAFAFTSILPLALRFFLGFGGELVEPMIRFESIVGFAITFALPFALIFQMPVVLFVFGRMGILTADKLRRFRKYGILIIFIVAAVLTPADAFSQIAMAIPLMILYELSIVLIRLAERSGRRSKEKETGETI